MVVNDEADRLFEQINYGKDATVTLEHALISNNLLTSQRVHTLRNEEVPYDAGQHCLVSRLHLRFNRLAHP